MTFQIIDAHAHCGVQDRSFHQAFENYFSRVRGSRITGVVMFAPVTEIYDRYDFLFEDTPEWQEKRRAANEYLLTVGNRELEVIPYFFIWNDFAVDQLTSQHKGIKWHRHSDEPVYHYDLPSCQKAVKAIRDRNLPVVLEEEFENTLRFINEIAKGVRVIIPHLGFLNGGYDAISDSGIYEAPNIFTDTSLAPEYDIMDYIERYGHERILFGSDFPFGDPRRELAKILNLRVSDEIKEAITGLNLKQMLGEVRSGE